MEALHNSEQWKGGDIPIRAVFTSPDPDRFNLSSASATFVAKVRGSTTAPIATLETPTTLTIATATASSFVVEGKIPASATASLQGASLTIDYLYTLTVGGFIFRGKQYRGSFTLKDPLP